MHFVANLYQMEVIAQQALQALSIMLNDIESAALQRTSRREARDDRTSAGFQHGPQRVRIGVLIARFGQKMQDGAIMPQVYLRIRPPLRHIPRNPTDVLRLGAKPLLRTGKRGSRNIENKNGGAAFVK